MRHDAATLKKSIRNNVINGWVSLKDEVAKLERNIVDNNLGEALCKAIDDPQLGINKVAEMFGCGGEVMTKFIQSNTYREIRNEYNDKKNGAQFLDFEEMVSIVYTAIKQNQSLQITAKKLGCSMANYAYTVRVRGLVKFDLAKANAMYKKYGGENTEVLCKLIVFKPASVNQFYDWWRSYHNVNDCPRYVYDAIDRIWKNRVVSTIDIPRKKKSSPVFSIFNKLDDNNKRKFITLANGGKFNELGVIYNCDPNNIKRFVTSERYTKMKNAMLHAIPAENKVTNIKRADDSYDAKVERLNKMRADMEALEKELQAERDAKIAEIEAQKAELDKKLAMLKSI